MPASDGDVQTFNGEKLLTNHNRTEDAEISMQYAGRKSRNFTVYCMPQLPPPATAMPKITFVVQGQEKTVDAASEETLLEVAQANGIPMEGACGGNGFCQTCKCRMRKGAENVSPLNEREEAMGMDGDERLGCQARIKGDVTVELES